MARSRADRWAAVLVVLAVAATLLAGATIAAAPAAAVAAPGTLSIVAAGIVSPSAVATGPDGNLWFTSPGNHTIGRLTPAGEVTSFQGPGINGPADITAGPDGNLWFTNSDGASIGRITPSGVVADFTGPGINAPRGIVVGPDGNLWFANFGSSSIGRITPAGVVTNFIDPGITSPTSVATGADGAVWFTNTAANGSLGRITTAGTVTTVALPGVAKPLWLAAGPDGALWSTSSDSSAIVRVTTAGVVTTFRDTGIAHPVSITAGPDGALWFTDQGGAIGRISTVGTVLNYMDALFNTGRGDASRGITTGPDGALWFGVWSGRAIGRLTTSGSGSIFRGKQVGSFGITQGPDGAMWAASFTTIQRLTPTGQVTAFSDPGITSASSIVTGPDGALWFTNTNDGSIGRITTAGVVTTFSVPPPAPALGSITVGPDGALWFTSSSPSGGSVGRITTTGAITSFTKSGITPNAITQGPDGALWFTNYFASSIGRITTAGSITVFADAKMDGPTGIATGADGALWFTNNNPNGSIGRMTTAGAVTTYTGGAPSIANPTYITAGQDGALWFTISNVGVGRVTTNGVMTTYASNAVRSASAIAPSADGGVWFTALGLVGRVQVASPAAAPTNVTAVAGAGRATVSWTPPAATGGSPITSSVVVANPSGARCVAPGTDHTCLVGGLPAGVAQTFTVVAINSAGPGVASAASNTVTPSAGPVGSRFQAVAPTRVLDSRTSVGGWSGPLSAGSPRTLDLRGGAALLPSSATAAILNVTVTNATKGSFVTAWPSGTTKPNASNLNFGAGVTIANQVTVLLGADGKVSFANAVGSTDVVADLVGYYGAALEAGQLFSGVPPTRVLDSRTPTGEWGGPLVAGAPRSLHVTGGWVPPRATAVVANITVTNSSAGSYVTAWRAGAPQPSASTVNFGPGATVANLSVVQVWSNGDIQLANAVGSADVIVDVVGYFEGTSGSVFIPLPPTRVLDDRTGTGLAGPWHPDTSRVLPVAGRAPVPSGATALVANVTATNPTAGSFVTVFPSDQNRPVSSNVNFGPGATVANLTVTALGTDGVLGLYNRAGTVDLVLDAVGYFAPA